MRKPFFKSEFTENKKLGDSLKKYVTLRKAFSKSEKGQGSGLIRSLSEQYIALLTLHAMLIVKNWIGPLSHFEAI